MNIALGLNRLKGYVKGTITRPAATTEPCAHANWGKNDNLTLNFILQKLIKVNRNLSSLMMPSPP